ncbi:MAG: carboxypeptidase-like regulatory domain-containing protein, partial [Prevotella sp.]|nr:carboxypeptidase-like regulatory domain-containing protein [Prevotella sp.]
MKRLTLFSLLLMMAVLVQAQHITGTVMESDTQEPLAQASIRLLKTDSSFVVGGLTDLEGRFR